jgi:protein-S-isoprenylcysteine O-methyltransferase Ste14
MRAWTPQTWYEAKPWAQFATGALLGIGMVAWSLRAGSWTAWRGLLCFAGAALAVVGGATLQRRQEYRARSKWRRETRR